MFEFLHPLYLVFIPVVIAARLYRPSWFQVSFMSLRHEATLNHSFVLRSVKPEESVQDKPALIQWLLAATLMLLFLALATPVISTGKTLKVPQSNRIVLVLDTSSSMNLKDFLVDGKTVSRLNVLKGLISAFIKEHEQDSFAVVVFGETAHVWVPATHDVEFIVSMIQRLFIGAAGEGTAIGDALGLAVLELDGAVTENSAGYGAIVLFTDGQNTEGTLSPYESAGIARARNIPVYTVSVASTRLPQQTLSQISDMTQARHYKATDTNALQEIVNDIGRETALVDKILHDTQHQHWYWMFVLIAGFLLIFRESIGLVRKQ